MAENVAKVGRFTVEFSMTESGMQCVWAPHQPRRGEITKKDLADYVEARNRWVAGLAKAIGGNILIVDV